MYEVYISLIVINFILLSIFVYKDIKSREIESIPFYATVLFLFGVIAYSVFFLNMLLVLLFSIFGIGLFLFSKKTGNIGEGDVPIFLSTLLIIIVASKLLLFIYFLVIFASMSFTLPFVLYKKTFSTIKRIIPVFLFIFITVLILFNKIDLALLLLMISLLYAIFSLYKKFDALYKESTKYLNPSGIVSGDLVVNSLLSYSQRKIIQGSNRLTLVTKDLLAKLDKNEKYPIYHNSIPMTVPIFIAFLISIIWLII